jgi:hypothetical protein
MSLRPSLPPFKPIFFPWVGWWRNKSLGNVLYRSEPAAGNRNMDDAQLLMNAARWVRGFLSDLPPLHCPPFLRTVIAAFADITYIEALWIIFANSFTASTFVQHLWTGLWQVVTANSSHWLF